MLEVLLSEIVHRKDHMFVTLRGYGSFYVNHPHIFPSQILSAENADALEQRLREDPSLSQFPRRRLTKPFNIVQIDAPIKTKTILPKEFIWGHYTEQMRNMIANPGTWVAADEHFLYLLKLKKQFDAGMQDVYEKIKLHFSENAPNFQTRVYNELNELFFENHLDELTTNIFMQRLPEAIIEQRRALHGVYTKIQQHCKAIWTGTLDLHFDELPFKPLRQLNYEELKQQKWLFLDIEIPHYQTDNAITWVGLLYYERGKEVKEMHTLSDLQTDVHEGYRIVTHATQTELVEAVRASILKEDPYIVSPYNARFDLLQLRERDAEFSIGEHNSVPVMEVTTKFLERIGIKGREVIDLLKWAQLSFDFLPNQKLEMTAKHVLGDERFEKSITYEEMDALEDKARTGNSDAAKTIASYLSDDVDVLRDLFLSPEFQHSLKDLSELAGQFHVPLSWMFYSSNAINHAQKRSYFQHVGIYRDEVFLKNKTMIEQRAKGKAEMRRMFEQLFDITPETGIYHNVHKTYISHGYFLRYLLERRFSEVMPLFERKHLNNHQRFYLSRFGNAVAEWMMIDYCLLKGRLDDFQWKLEKHGLTESQFNPFFTAFEDALNEDERRKFDVYQLSSRQVQSHIPPDSLMKDFSLDQIVDLLVLKKRVDRGVKKMLGNYKVAPFEIAAALEYMKDLVMKFADERNLKLIYQEGPYLYFAGDDDFEKSPVRKVDSIDTAMVTVDDKGASKLYYKRHGYFHNFKVVGHPTNRWTLFDQETFGPFLNYMLQGDYLSALDVIYRQTDLLMAHMVEPEKLVMRAKQEHRYSAFEHGDKIHFYLPPFSGETIKDDSGRAYTVEEMRGEEIKVFIMSIADLQPDWKIYLNRHQGKVLAMLHGFLGEAVYSFFEKEPLSESALERYADTMSV
ncbi:hypothetical protein C4573_05420 [Candidatus Woesearchaeota archaeon]|nr:MAG: hypothetical protein C4573_05420 [Candidatus Woesearchaeota archaeon]